MNKIVNAFFPKDAAIQATDTFNDAMGSKHSGPWRTVSAGPQAGVYGLMAWDAFQKAQDHGDKVIASIKGGHYGDGVVGLIPMTAYAAGGSVMTTFALSAVATGLNKDLADRRAARVN